MSPPVDPRRAAGLPYFFYGTLVDRELLAAVAGEMITRQRVQPASVAGYRRTGLVGRRYPILIRRLGARVDGILIHGLAKPARARLAAYEGANYKLIEVAATDGRKQACQALVFVSAGPASGLVSNRRRWRLDLWQWRWKGRAMRRAKRLMLRTASRWG